MKVSRWVAAATAAVALSTGCAATTHTEPSRAAELCEPLTYSADALHLADYTNGVWVTSAGWVLGYSATEDGSIYSTNGCAR